MKSVMLARDDFTGSQFTDHFDNLIEQLFPGMSEEKRDNVNMIDLRVYHAGLDDEFVEEV